MPASWLASLDRYFFAADDGRNLNLFRALFCGALACVHFTKIFRLEHL
jgi:hypothetical protein